MNPLQKKVLREVISKIDNMYLSYPGQSTGSELETLLIDQSESDKRTREEVIDWLRTLLKDK